MSRFEHLIQHPGARQFFAPALVHAAPEIGSLVHLSTVRNLAAMARHAAAERANNTENDGPEAA